MAQRAPRTCEYCLISAEDCYFGLEPDHIISRKHGGMSEAGNLALACVFCNRHKGTDLASFSQRTGLLVPLYIPRQERWTDHFALGIDGATIVPISDVGEVAVRILRMNAANRVTERVELRRAGRYPTPEARFVMSRDPAG